MFDSAQNKPSTKYGSARLCVYLTDYERHLEYRAQLKNSIPCEAFGADSYNICGLCNAPIKLFSKREFHTNTTCFLKYHSDIFFGLARSDSTLLWKN